MSRVAWGFTCSLDGIIAGPYHDMSWLSSAEALDSDLAQRLAGAVGAILSGRRGYDASLAQAGERDDSTPEAYGGAWTGIEYVLTHRPDELADDPRVIAPGSPGPGIIPLDCDIRVYEGAERSFGRTYRPKGRRSGIR